MKGLKIKFLDEKEDIFTLKNITKRNIFSLAIIAFLVLFQILFIFAINIQTSFKVVLIYYNSIIFLLTAFLIVYNIFFQKNKKENKSEEIKFKIVDIESNTKKIKKSKKN